MASETSRPKRPYTVTGKVRQARLASLAKAREKARLARRGYKRGAQEDDLAYQARLDRQIKPWCRNLRQAAAARKADRSADYASHFIHGLSAPDLDRSAPAAGEDRDELRRHLERCRRTIGGLAGVEGSELLSSKFGVGTSEYKTAERDSESAADPELRTSNSERPTSNPDPRAPKLVLALAYVFWRSLRLLRTQVRWEGRALALRLQELHAWRSPNGALTAGRLNQFQSDLHRVTTDVAHAWDRLRKLRKRFEALWTVLFDPERWQRLAEHIRAPSQFPNQSMHMPAGATVMDLLVASLGGLKRRGRRRRAKSGAAQSGGGERGEEESAAPGVPPAPRPRAPRNPFHSHFDPREYLCRTHSQGGQDWRLRLDELSAEALGLPFQSPSHVERALERQSAGAGGEAGDGRERPGGDSGRQPPRPRRAWQPGAHLPADALLAELAKSGQLVDINSLSMLQDLLAQCFHEGDAQKPEVRRQARQSVAAVAEALWTRIEGFRVLVETLEETLRQVLEHYASGCSGGLPTAGKRTGDAPVRTPPLPSEAPDYNAVLKSRQAAILQSRAAGRGPEDSLPGLSLDDLRIHLDPFLPNATPLDGLRQWFEAAEGVRDAGLLLAQRVDVALYEFAVRRFGIRREFVAWRPELGLDQWRAREGRAEWAPRVTTVDGQVLVKVSGEDVQEVSH